MMLLTGREQEYLLHAILGAHGIAESGDFFLWSQGPLQTLLPHDLLICAQLGADGAVLRSEAWHSIVPDHAQLRERQVQLARLALAWRAGGQRAGVIDGVLVHGSAGEGGGSFFALFAMGTVDAARQAYALELLLPYLHLHWLALPASRRAPPAGPGATRAASARELEVLHWVREGKSNDEVGQILGISGTTVKSHLQRIYKLLGVSNRTQAVSRGIALRLLSH
ncbi:transcriptional activator protein EsaR [Janthinobacterium sp. HH107]|uniref:LuxR C-terminal-related transcriptional regulator n=1 Tax=unclassified Janthinobacterium TaxID=2610881 RepID=UPI00087512D9|nr:MULTISPECIES: LuxR C-terminal-related transcriptional regulator [unclassified Janthinobacterium]OEZ73445.1 transcriptional activator protein EsaR [Janthinobacterium sp. HH100]OEZ89777.1 transcriptional activator protein EsaR [Janthinobacterium sp. HH106]OEZ96417.1 transcriptional activator protein EsaR [Janthinobacterium sp. HH107]QOU72367.1 Bacterial regulatory protein, luxR family [Janthinobacterium sp. HH102]